MWLQQKHWEAGPVNTKLLLQVKPPVDLTFAICSLSCCPSPPVSHPRAPVCPHMFSVPSPFARAVVIGKPGVLLFQRPGSMEREVILGPQRTAWEHSGGRWVDKNQTWPRQEHADVHMHRLSCTYITVHSQLTMMSRCHKFHHSKHNLVFSPLLAHHFLVLMEG